MLTMLSHASSVLIIISEEIKLRAIQDFKPSEIRHRERIEFESFLKNQGLAHFRNDENESQRIDRQGNNDVEPIPFERGDTMVTIPPVTIGDNVGWWKVRHLISGKTGLIPRNRVVIAANDHQSPSRTTLYDLPLELLDTVLENSFLHWILNCSPQQKNEDAIKALTSVDFCWFQRITRRRFKKRIWHRLKDFYEKIKRGSVIIRNSQNYLLENIQPTEALIASLLSLDCITDEQRRVIQQQRSIRIRNAELQTKKYPDGNKNSRIIGFMRSFDQTNLSNFVKCLRRTNPTQKMVARTIENGGVVIKVEIRNRCATRLPSTSMETQKLVHQSVEDLRNRTNPLSNQTDKIMSELNDEGLEILNSQMDRQAVVVWIWCRSQTSLQCLQKLYDSNQLRDVLSCLTNIPPEIMQSKVINIHSNQFWKTVVVGPVSVNLTEIIDVYGGDEYVRGVTKLRNEIYVVCRSYSDAPNVICVYEDRSPYRLKRKIEIKAINEPFDFGSSEKENCLYISDYMENCIWKITREADDQHKIIKWLETKYWNFSVSNDNHLLLFSYSSPVSLMIYGSDAKLDQPIPLPRNIVEPRHAVQTSIGNFIILHKSSEIKSTEDEDEDEQSDDEEEEDNDDVEEEDDEHEDMEEKKEQLIDGRAYIEEKEAKKGKEAECMKEKKDEREEVKENRSRERKSMEHEKDEDENLGERRPSGGNKKDDWCISEVSKDGKMVNSRFIPLNEKQKLIKPRRLLLDSDDRVFVADSGNNRVVLLDSYLKWNRIICETRKENVEGEDKDKIFLQSDFLCYDEEKEQLIVSDYNQRRVYVYNLGRI